MVCDAFQFQCERSQCLRPFRRACAGQGFEYPRISGSRCRGTVSGGGFHEVNRPFVGTADQHFFNAAVLISKFDFKRIDIFAHTLKTEMPRFDHACVNRPHRDLMGGGAFHRKIIRDSGDRFAGTPPYIRCAVHVFVETDRLEPGMPQRHDAGLFGNFALEPVKLRALFRQGFIRGADNRRNQAKGGRRIIGKHGDQFMPLFLLQREKGRYPHFLLRDRLNQRFAEFGELRARQGRQRRRGAVFQNQKRCIHIRVSPYSVSTEALCRTPVL